MKKVEKKTALKKTTIRTLIKPVSVFGGGEAGGEGDTDAPKCSFLTLDSNDPTAGE